MACEHVWEQINDVGVCKKCGLTISKYGEVMFDKYYVNRKKKDIKKGHRECVKK